MEHWNGFVKDCRASPKKFLPKTLGIRPKCLRGQNAASRDEIPGGKSIWLMYLPQSVDVHRGRPLPYFSLSLSLVCLAWPAVRRTDRPTAAPATKTAEAAAHARPRATEAPELKSKPRHGTPVQTGAVFCYAT